jgi:hypothetical protein
MIKVLINFLFASASILIGVPCAFFGILGLRGRLADAGYAFNVRAGIVNLGLAAFVWIASLAWFWWSSGHELPSRFSMRTLLIVFTLIAIALGLFAALP